MKLLAILFTINLLAQIYIFQVLYIKNKFKYCSCETVKSLQSQISSHISPEAVEIYGSHFKGFLTKFNLSLVATLLGNPYLSKF